MKPREQEIRIEIKRLNDNYRNKSGTLESGAEHYLAVKESQLLGYLQGCEDTKKEYETRGLFITEGINDEVHYDL